MTGPARYSRYRTPTAGPAYFAALLKIPDKFRLVFNRKCYQLSGRQVMLQFGLFLRRRSLRSAALSAIGVIHAHTLAPQLRKKGAAIAFT